MPESIHYRIYKRKRNVLPLAADVITGAMGGAERCLVPTFMKSLPLSMKQIYF